MAHLDREIEQLKKEVIRLASGAEDAEGHPFVKFGILVRDDRCNNVFEALVGTLKAAKKRKVIAYNSELLLQGPHDNVDIVLLQQPEPEESEAVESKATE